MSSSTSPSDWFHHFYNLASATTPPPSATTLSDQTFDATVVSTTVNTAIATATTTDAATTNTTSTNNYTLDQMGLGGPDPFLSALSSSNTVVSGRSGQESRVSRPTRRRSRASRKNPTTLLNTDTTNFRAMVQRYTGGSANVTYSPLESTSLGGGFHQGQMGNFSHLHGPMAGVDLRASQLHQQLLMQQQHGFASTANMSASSASPVDPRATLPGRSDQFYSSAMGDENKRGGFMF